MNSKIKVNLVPEWNPKRWSSASCVLVCTILGRAATQRALPLCFGFLISRRLTLSFPDRRSVAKSAVQNLLSKYLWFKRNAVTVNYTEKQVWKKSVHAKKRAADKKQVVDITQKTFWSLAWIRILHLRKKRKR